MADIIRHAEPHDSNRPILTAIIAGTIVALGLMVLFTLLGLAIGGENAVLNEQDLAEAESTLQARLGISPNESRQMVDAVQSAFDSVNQTLRQSATELRERLVAAADDVQNAVATAALWLLIASLLGLGAAAGAGLFGCRD